MEVGIGLPNAVRSVDRAGIVEWSRRAEEAGFASLGTIDRLVYPSWESLISLAAAAAVTERIRLATDILIAPLHPSPAVLAKQTATIDALSAGRLTLGLAVGGRQDDYEAAGVDFHRRGRLFEQQLQEMTAVWAGERGVGPQPPNGRPRLLIGGGADVAYRRAAQYGDGWTMGGGPPEMFSQALEKLNSAWSEAGREGKPYAMALFYFALGSDGERAARENLGHYYSFLGPYAEQIVAGAAKDPDAVKQYLSAFEAAGADEVICFPASPELDQVSLLAEAALG